MTTAARPAPAPAGEGADDAAPARPVCLDPYVAAARTLEDDAEDDAQRRARLERERQTRTTRAF